MGSNIIFALLRFFRLNAWLATVSASLVLLTSCISDGPNQTGGQFLSKQDILLNNPLYHVVLPSFPVDSFWNSDAEPSHLGDTILMAGIAGNFIGQARMAFDLADTNYLDSLSDSASMLRLSVGAVPTTGVGLTELIGTVGDTGASSATYRDSLAFLVETWAVANRDAGGLTLTEAARKDTLSLYNRRFLFRQDTLAALPKVTIWDTIKLQIKGAYAKDNWQSRSLPHLYNLLRSQPSSIKWLIQIQLTPIPDSSKTGPAMLRLGGEISSSYGPILLFGKSKATAGTATAKQKLGTLTTVGRKGVNYTLKYYGSPFDILPAKVRGLHLLLDRVKLLDSLNAALKRQGITPPKQALQGKYDFTYFVPFGRIGLPLADSLHLEGGFPLDMRLASDLDSNLPNLPIGALAVKTIPMDAPTVLSWGFENGNYTKATDSISVIYRHAPLPDSGLRQIIVRLGKDTLKNDSQFVSVGQTKEIVVNRASPAWPLVVTVLAGQDSARVRYFFGGHFLNETQELKDAKTGVTLKELSDNLPRFLHAGQHTLDLRATNSLQRILNRTEAGLNVFPDFLVQPAAQSAVDSSVIAGSTNKAQRIPYPVLSIVPPKIQGGRLNISLDLYLYPLKEER